jgi:hypothetical protein
MYTMDDIVEEWDQLPKRLPAHHQVATATCVKTSSGTVQYDLSETRSDFATYLVMLSVTDQDLGDPAGKNVL